MSNQVENVENVKSVENVTSVATVESPEKTKQQAIEYELMAKFTNSLAINEEQAEIVKCLVDFAIESKQAVDNEVAKLLEYTVGYKKKYLVNIEKQIDSCYGLIRYIYASEVEFSYLMIHTQTKNETVAKKVASKLNDVKKKFDTSFSRLTKAIASKVATEEAKKQKADQAKANLAMQQEIGNKAMETV